jgi:hypothetical protein
LTNRIALVGKAIISHVTITWTLESGDTV